MHIVQMIRSLIKELELGQLDIQIQLSGELGIWFANNLPAVHNSACKIKKYNIEYSRHLGYFCNTQDCFLVVSSLVRIYCEHFHIFVHWKLLNSHQQGFAAEIPQEFHWGFDSER